MKHIFHFLQLIFLLFALAIVTTPQKYHNTRIVLGEWQLIAGSCQLIMALFLSYKYNHIPSLKKDTFITGCLYLLKSFCWLLIRPLNNTP
jgi:hypothetical protein